MILTAREERWPIRGRFAISRGSRAEARVVVAEVSRDGTTGRGECVPYQRYGETVEGVLETLHGVAADSGPDGGVPTRADLAARLPPGAARNALDCALWDLEAGSLGLRAWELAAVAAPVPAVTAVTVSLGDPGVMGEAARRQADHPLLKIKLGDTDVVESVRAVRENAPAARLIVDANEAWTLDLLTTALPELKALGVEVIEQPLPAGQDAALRGINPAVRLCADESCHVAGDVAGLADRYQLVNVKLDKAGGLTEALAVSRAAAEAGLGLMVGCMVGTSLAMAPATLLADHAEYVDLDGPLILEGDRPDGLSYANGHIHRPDPALWG